MNLISLIVTLAIVGVVLWMVNSYVPMDAKIKNILNIAVVIFVCLWLLSAFGLMSGMSNMYVGPRP